MKLKLNENIGARGAALLSSAGHDVSTVLAQGMCGSSDPVLVRACTDEGRALVTLDLDFANPLRFPPGSYAGIAVLRLPRAAAPADLLLCIETLAVALRTQHLSGQLWVVEKNRIREYDKNRS